MKPQVPEDAKVYVTHLRLTDGPLDPGKLAIWTGWPFATAHDLREYGYGISAKGGITLVQIEFADGRTSRGAATCSPRDNFCKATGREIATGRALKNAELGLNPPYHEHIGVTP